MSKLKDNEFCCEEMETKFKSGNKHLAPEIRSLPFKHMKAPCIVCRISFPSCQLVTPSGDNTDPTCKPCAHNRLINTIFRS